MADCPRFAAFSGTNGRAIYVNPQHVSGVIQKDKGSTIVVAGTFFYDVNDSADNVCKVLGWV